MNIPGWMSSMSRAGRIASATDAYEVVPMLYRAVNLRCDAISTVPYTLTRRGVEVEWPWQQTVSSLMRDTERSLLLTGGAYWYRIVKGRTMTGFVVLNPTTMTVGFEPTMSSLENPYSGALFTQTQLGRTYGPWNIDSIVYFREPSYRDDILPGLAPAQVALQSAQLGHYLERFTSAFFEGGAQPVMVMNLPEAMDDAEFQRFRGEFATRLGGVANAFRSLFVRAPELKVQKVTPDINTMMLPELQERVITSIAMTLGVPRTMLEASAANYATADSDRQSFWRETIVPRLGLYEQIINGQLLAPIGYEIRFNPEMLDVMQADEADRADSLLKLTQAGLPLPDAMRILGYDGVDDMFLAPPTPAPTDELPKEATPQEPSTPVGAIAPAQPDTATRSVDWALLAKKLERRIKAGKTPWCDFDSAVISADEVKSVMARISEGATVSDVVGAVAEVKAVDDMTPDERRIYNAIAPELAKRGATWARQIVQGKEVDPTLKDVVAPVLNAELATQMGKRIDKLGTQFSIPMDTNDESQQITDWLSDYVPLTTSRIDQTTADRIKPIIETYRTTPGMTIDDLTAMMRPLSDPARARMIAVTETTRAAAQATVEYQKYLGRAGITMIRVWNTDADEKVCPICTGQAYGVNLNGMTEDEWPAEVAGGPPAHVNCRCDTSLRLVRP
jgi:HK97 family phage portal protein